LPDNPQAPYHLDSLNIALIQVPDRASPVRVQIEGKAR
jgi:hypothetical protein